MYIIVFSFFRAAFFLFLHADFFLFFRANRLPLSYVPMTLSDCKSLSHLSLSNNSLRDIPDDFAALSSLIHLDIRGNAPYLAEIPGEVAAISGLAELKMDPDVIVRPLQAVMAKPQASYFERVYPRFAKRPDLAVDVDKLPPT